MSIRPRADTITADKIKSLDPLCSHRQARSLDRRRIQLYCGILPAVEIAFFLFIACNSGLIVPKLSPSSSDFVSFYAAGKLADTAKPQLAYHQSTHFAAAEQTNPPLGYKFFYHPPVLLLLCSIPARFPHSLPFIIFEGLVLLLYLFAARSILGERGWAAFVPLLAFPEVFWALISGQNPFLTAALFGAATLFADRRPVISGLLFGALCHKPHFGLLVPVALVAGRRWRTFAAAFTSVAGSGTIVADAGGGACIGDAGRGFCRLFL